MPYTCGKNNHDAGVSCRETVPEIRIYQKVLPCPVCQQETLIGYRYELNGAGLEYDELFLPKATRKAISADGFVVDNLTIFNNYFCSEDLFAYSGKVTMEDGIPQLTRNIFYNTGRYFRVRDQIEFSAERLRFFLLGLKQNGLTAASGGPINLSKSGILAMSQILTSLIDASIQSEMPSEKIYREYQALLNKTRWHPLRALSSDFYRNKPFVITFMERQLGDLIFEVRRIYGRNPRHVRYGNLYEALAGALTLIRTKNSIDEGLMGVLLFHCLRLSSHVEDERKNILLQAAYALSTQISRFNLRLGADLNAHLAQLSENPDVIFYLMIKLGRILNKEADREKTLLRHLKRRLANVEMYHVLKKCQDSEKIYRIGGLLQKHCKELFNG